MGLFRKSGHTLQQRREAEDRAQRMGHYYSHETTIAPLPDGGRVEVKISGLEGSIGYNPGPAFGTQTTVYDKNGRVLEKRRSR